MTEFISRRYGNEDYEVIIKTDSHEHYKVAEAFARRLIGHAKPMTIGDRIRAMTDEELAKILIEANGLETSIHFCQNKPECETLLDHDMLTDEHCIVCMLEWLKQPVEAKER